MSHRRAITLIELLVVISASVIVLGLIAGLIGSLARAERSAEQHLAEGERIAQLCESFRRSVWAATSAECAEGDNAMELTLEGDRKIELRAKENQVTEMEQASGQAIHQERFDLSLGEEVRFAIRPEHENIWASMAIARRSGQPTERVHEIQIDALVGRDRRFRAKDE